MGFRLVSKSVALNDLERRNNHSPVAALHPFGLSWGYYYLRKISQCTTCILLGDIDNGMTCLFCNVCLCFLVAIVLKTLPKYLLRLLLHIGHLTLLDKMLSYRGETALQGAL